MNRICNLALVTALSLAIQAAGCSSSPLNPRPKRHCLDGAQIDSTKLVADDNPVFSNGGEWIAFRGLYDSAGNFARGIYLTDTCGSVRMSLGIDGIAHEWMPGDSELVLVIGENLYLYNLNSKQTLDLRTTVRFPVPFDVSRTKRQIYYKAAPPSGIGPSWIWRLDLNTGVKDTIIGGGAGEPAISPNDSLLAFVAPGPFLVVLDLYGYTVDTLAELALAPRWSNDGSMIAFNHFTAPNTRVGIADTSGKVVILDNGISINASVDFTPDDGGVVFSSEFLIGITRYSHIWKTDIKSLVSHPVTR